MSFIDFFGFLGQIDGRHFHYHTPGKEKLQGKALTFTRVKAPEDLLGSGTSSSQCLPISRRQFHGFLFGRLKKDLQNRIFRCIFTQASRVPYGPFLFVGEPV